MSGESHHDPENDVHDPGATRTDCGDPDLDPIENHRQEELQEVQDLGSASRSCVAIIAVLLIMAILLCVFLIWASVIR